jgi:hypothetical protein
MPFDELLKGARTRVGNFFDDQFDRLNQFGGRLQQAIPGNIVRPVPDTQRVMLREPQQSDTLRKLGSSLQKGTGQGEGKGEGEEQTKVANDKMTIKKELPDGRKVTISVDLPQQDQQQQPTPTPTIIPEFQGVRPDIQDAIRQEFPQDLQNQAINVAARESSLNPRTVQQEANPVIPELGRRSRDIGTFQLNEFWQRFLLEEYGLDPINNPDDLEALLDPVLNARIAADLVERSGGFSPFVGARGL